jgi:ABC-type transport system involved in multi-copper enzyme maturation permease subunit
MRTLRSGLHLSLGPVYAYEWLIATRRWQMYALRAAFVGLLLCGLGLVWISQWRAQNLSAIQKQAEIGRAFYQSLVFVEVSMVLLAAPAATAGAICLDKARGTLLHVMVTDLSDSEIVLGKLAARLVPVLGMIASSLPVLAIGTLLGGIDPVALTGALAVTTGLAVLGCTLALALSVWGRKTHEVLLTMYFIWIVWLLLMPAWTLLRGNLWGWTNPPDWMVWTHPYMLTVSAHDPSWPQSPGLGIQGLFLLASVALSAALVVLTVRRLRPVVIGQWGQGEQPRTPARVPARSRVRAPAWSHVVSRLGWLDPTLDGNPVLWREWHRQRPSRWTRIVWGLYLVLAIAFSAIAVFGAMGASGGPRDLPSGVSALQIMAGFLLLCVTAGTSLTEERTRGSLDVLLATPLSTASIVWGKWWGAFRAVPLLALVPALVAVATIAEPERAVGPFLVLAFVLAIGAAITSLGLALATWFRKLSTVLALCVTSYVAVTVGWLFLVLAMMFLLFQNAGARMGNFPLYVVMASPPYGVGVVSAAIAEQGGQHIWPGAAVAAIFWTAVYAGAAGLLLAATLKSFDRCLGRMPENGQAGNGDRQWLERKAKPRVAVALVEDV